MAHLMTCTVAVMATMAGPVQAADIFLDAATNPAFMRDAHLVSAGGYGINSARTNDGQNIGMSYYQLEVGTNIWNNERNQVLAGIQSGRRTFDQTLALPDGFSLPRRIDNASASLLYKHITSGDWSFSQSVRYAQYRTDSPAITARDSVDVIGLAAVSREPGVAWAFGYIYAETDYLEPAFLPIIEYVNTRHDRWAITVGFPVLSFSVSPHPDWTLGGGGVSYKVTEQNIVRLSYAGSSWAYRLEEPEATGKGIVYTANRAGLDWTYLYYIDHRTVVVLNASLGWEFNRKIGSKDNKLAIDDGAVMGLNASLAF